MASKRPIIASNLPSIREIVSEKEVLFFKSDDSKKLALNITKLLKDNKLQELLSKNAFEKVKSYTWEKRVKEIINFIQC
jgi:glycosyltransferase involved in cell wall biosynthesis